MASYVLLRYRGYALRLGEALVILGVIVMALSMAGLV
jgi:hypothetical protein